MGALYCTSARAGRRLASPTQSSTHRHSSPLWPTHPDLKIQFVTAFPDLKIK
jgi:hypothetical protein